MLWSVHIAHGHGERIAAMPDEFRTVAIYETATREPAEYSSAMSASSARRTRFIGAPMLAKSRTIVMPANFLNLFLIVAVGFRATRRHY